MIVRYATRNAAQDLEPTAHAARFAGRSTDPFGSKSLAVISAEARFVVGAPWRIHGIRACGLEFSSASGRSTSFDGQRVLRIGGCLRRPRVLPATDEALPFD